MLSQEEKKRIKHMYKEQQQNAGITPKQIINENSRDGICVLTAMSPPVNSRNSICTLKSSDEEITFEFDGEKKPNETLNTVIFYALIAICFVAGVFILAKFQQTVFDVFDGKTIIEYGKERIKINMEEFNSSRRKDLIYPINAVSSIIWYLVLPHILCFLTPAILLLLPFFIWWSNNFEPRQYSIREALSANSIQCIMIEDQDESLSKITIKTQKSTKCFTTEKNIGVKDFLAIIPKGLRPIIRRSDSTITKHDT